MDDIWIIDEDEVMLNFINEKDIPQLDQKDGLALRNVKQTDKKKKEEHKIPDVTEQPISEMPKVEPPAPPKVEPPVQQNIEKPKVELPPPKPKVTPQPQKQKKTKHPTTQKPELKLTKDVNRDENKEFDGDDKTTMLGRKPTGPKLTNLETGESYPIKPPVTIGKNSSCDIQIRDNVISRHHATILKHGDKYFIIDPNSTNGTFIDGQEIPKDTEIELKVGQVITLADKEFKFE